MARSVRTSDVPGQPAFLDPSASTILQSAMVPLWAWRMMSPSSWRRACSERILASTSTRCSLAIASTYPLWSALKGTMIGEFGIAAEFG